MSKCIPIFLILGLFTVISGCEQKRTAFDTLNDQNAMAELDSNFCRKDNLKKKNMYEGQNKIHTNEECKLIFSYMLSNPKDPSVTKHVRKITNGKYPPLNNNIKKDVDYQAIANSMQKGLDLMSGKAGNNISTGSQTCHFQNSSVSGFNRICNYSCTGSRYALTISSTQLCSLTINK